MIKIDHVTFTYRENNEHSAGIRDIDLTIEDGQVVVLCGGEWLWQNNAYATDQRSDPALL